MFNAATVDQKFNRNIIILSKQYAIHLISALIIFKKIELT